MKNLPRIVTVQQKFPRPRVVSVEKKTSEEFQQDSDSLPDLSGKSVAVAVGSRGISEISAIVASVVQALRLRGARPFVVPAMGSHGGGTAAMQREILYHYDVTPERVGAPVVSSMETNRFGTTLEGAPVFVDREALEADGIFLVNRIKAHTDFKGSVGSGLMKMMAVGLGNRDSAATFHRWAQQLGYERQIESSAQVLIESGKILGGIGILENAYHDTAHLELLPAPHLMSREKELLKVANGLAPSIPVGELDILVVDRIGKNISGTGMDPNVTGRWFRGSESWQESPAVKRIVVLGLTEESGGNALGIGVADFCTAELISRVNRDITYLNVLTSQNLIAGRLPVYYETVEETVKHALDSLGDDNGPEEARLIRIRDTLDLTKLEASESLVPELQKRAQVSSVTEPREMEFTAAGDLPQLL